MAALTPGQIALISYSTSAAPQTIGSVTATVTTSVVTGSIAATGAVAIGSNTATVTVSVVTGAITSGAAVIGSTTATVTMSVATGGITGSGAATIGANTATVTVSVVTGAIGNTTADPYPLTVTIRETQALATIRESQALALREGRRMSGRVVYNQNAERPALSLWLLDRNGSLIDFSSGYSFSLKVGERGETALLTKTSGITGAAGSGTAPTGTPNVVVTWTAGELNLTPGTYLWQLTATTSSTDRVYEGTLVILDAIN